MRSLCSKLSLLTLIVGLVPLVSCSSEPTSESRDPSLATTTVYLTVSGPNVVTSGLPISYTYEAYMGASYPTFYPWGIRTCPTKSITGCTAPWSTVYGYTHDTYWNKITQTLAEDCSGGGTKTFQARAQASAFGIPTQTAYRVTALCRGLQ
jgi:hypothetical protein